MPLPVPGASGPTFETWRALHRRFHLALVAGCGSAWLLRFRHILYEQSERYRFLSHTARPRDVDGEHRTIMQATFDRGVAEAVKGLSDHLALTAAIIVENHSDLESAPRARTHPCHGIPRPTRGGRAGTSRKRPRRVPRNPCYGRSAFRAGTTGG
jgi:FCD domain